MIIPDVNLLVYAHNAGAAQHVAARAWAERTFSGTEPVRIPWTTLYSADRDFRRFSGLRVSNPLV